MVDTAPSIRVLVTLALLVALIAIANPAAADPALESVLAAVGPPGGTTPECYWWALWC